MEEQVQPLLSTPDQSSLQPAKGASALASIATLLNSAIGAGVLALPFAFRCAGWAGGLLTTLVVASIEAFTLYVLSRYAEHTRTATYSSLVRTMLGRKASGVMSLVLLVYGYGSAIGYMIILGDCFQPLAAQAFGDTWFTQRETVITVLSSLFMLPLCFPTSLAAISGASAVTFYALIVVVGCIMERSVHIVRSPDYDWGNLQAFNWSMQWFGALPIIVFGFQCHTNVVAVWEELEPEPVLFPSSASLTNLIAAATGSVPSSPRAVPAARNGNLGGSAASSPAVPTRFASSPTAPRFPSSPPVPTRFLSSSPTVPGFAGSPGAHRASSPTVPRIAQLQGQVSGYEHLPCQVPSPFRPLGGRRPKSQKLLGMTKVVTSAILVTGCFYCLVGTFGYLAFPTSAKSNILNSFSPSDRVMQVARAVVGVIETVHYPVNHNPARSATRDFLSLVTGRKLRGQKFNIIETLFFFSSTLATALLVRDLGVVFQFVGGICGAFFIFGAPGCLLIQYAYAKHVQVRGEVGSRLLERAALGADEYNAEAIASLEEYHYAKSKLFWAGVALVGLGLGLGGITLYTIINPY